MKRAIWFAIVAALLLAWPVHGAEVGTWTHGYGATGGKCDAVSVPGRGNQCFWTGASGNSPLIGNSCRGKALIWVTGTLSAKLYKCRDATFGNCTQPTGFKTSTLTYELVTLDATDDEVLNVPYDMIMMEYVSGSGEVVIECGS